MKKQTQIVIELSKNIVFIINLDGHGGGTIESSGVHYDETTEIENTFENESDFDGYESQINAIESLILAHACAGVDVKSKPYKNGIQTTLDAIGND